MSSPVSRREFAGMIVAGSIAATETANGNEPKKPPADESKGEPKPRKEAESSQTPATPADLVTELVLRQYPHPDLTGEMLDEVRSDVSQNLSRSRILSNFPLSNADEPGFRFTAWRGDPSQ